MKSPAAHAASGVTVIWWTVPPRARVDGIEVGETVVAATGKQSARVKDSNGFVLNRLQYALFEEATFDESGTLMSGTFADYLLPSAADLPSFTAERTETPATTNPLGVKGVGEIAITGTAGAIANAVWHATGVRVRQFPITLEPLMGL